MADIFLSHSSADIDAATRIKSWLERDRETWSVFLDRHPTSGIEAGQSWQDRLRRELESCRVVLAIITPDWLRSRWCFAEAVTAAFKGKDFFGVLPDDIDDAELQGAPSIVHERQRQQIDLATGAGWDALLRGLDRSGLDPNEWFPIAPGVGPFPGFVAFEERDAGVFFGRDAEITEYLTALNLLRAADRAQALVISGGSGSGKSSLLKAGLIPRLRQQPDWRVIPPFDPSREPIHALFAALRATAEATGVEISLPRKPPPSIDDLTQCLHDSLRRIEEKTGAWMLLPLDQAEVLVAGSQENNETDASRLLSAIGALLASRKRRLVCVLTIRTEFMPALERALPAQVHLQDRSLRSIVALSDVIEKPAARFGIQLEEGLSGRMVEETRGADALPLLAYTLRQLYEQYGEDDHLTVAEYEQLGGVEGAIETKLVEALSDPEPSPAELAAFRRAFVRQFVRVDENAVEGERYLRRAVKRESLPDLATRLFDRLEDARLLIGGDDGTIGIAHERFIRNWRDVPLRTWLVEGREDRKLIDSLKSFQAAHEAGGPLLSEKPLLDARDFLARDSSLVEQEPGLVDFIQASLAAERNRERRRKMVVVGSVAAALVFLLVAIVAVWSFLEARERTAEAELATLAADSARISALALLPERATDALVGAIQLVAPIARSKVSLPAQAVRGLTDAIAAVGFSVPENHALIGHEGGVESVAVSSDGRRILTTGGDRTVRLWDAGTLELLETYARPDAFAMPGVAASSFSPDGRKAVVAVPNRALLLDSETGQVLGGLRGDERGVFFAGFSQDGSRVLTTGRGWVRIWDAAAGDQIGEAIEARGAVLFAALSPDNSTLAYGGQRQVLVIRDLESGEQVEHQLGGYALSGAFSPTGRELVVSSAQESVIWTVRSDDVSRRRGTGRIDSHAFADRLVAMGPDIVELGFQDTELITRLPRSGGNDISFSALSRDATLAVTGETANRSARVWNARTGELLAILEGHAGSVLSAAFSPDGRRVVTASSDGTARVWDLRLDLSLVAIPTGAAALERVVVSPDGQRIVGINRDGEAFVSDAAGNRVARLDARLFPYWTPPVFTADGTRLLAATEDDAARMWDTATGRTLTEYRGHEATVRSAALSPDETLVATGGDDGTVRLWRAESGEPHGAPLRHEGRVGTVQFSPDGGRIVSSGVGVSGDEDHRGLIWSTDGALLAELEGDVEELEASAFSPDGSMIVGEGQGGKATVWDARTGNRLRSFDASRTLGVHARFSPDGLRVVTTDSDGVVSLWDPRTDADPIPFRGDQGEAQEAQFSPEGTRLISYGSHDLRLWDIESGFVMVEFAGQRNRERQVSIMPGGSRLVAARGSSLKIFPLTVESFLSMGCEMLRHRERFAEVEGPCGELD